MRLNKNDMNCHTQIGLVKSMIIKLASGVSQSKCRRYRYQSRTLDGRLPKSVALPHIFLSMIGLTDRDVKREREREKEISGEKERERESETSLEGLLYV